MNGYAEKRIWRVIRKTSLQLLSLGNKGYEMNYMNYLLGSLCKKYLYNRVQFTSKMLEVEQNENKVMGQWRG